MLISPTCYTGEDTHAHACTPAVQALARGQVRSCRHRQPDTGPGPSQTPHSRQPDNGRDNRRRHNGYHDRARNGVNPAPREQNRVARVCVRARERACVRGCAQGCAWEAVGGFFARAGARARGSAMEWCVQVCLYNTGSMPGACPGEAALTFPLAPCGASPGLQSGSLISFTHRGVPGGRSAGMGDTVGMGMLQGWGHHGDGDLKDTPVLEGQGPRRAPGSPYREGAGAPGCLGSPHTPQAQLSPLGIPWVGTPGCPAPCCTQAGALSPP